MCGSKVNEKGCYSYKRKINLWFRKLFSLIDHLKSLFFK